MFFSFMSLSRLSAFFCNFARNSIIHHKDYTIIYMCTHEINIPRPDIASHGMLTITLNDLRFYAHHGVLPQEREVGAEFVLNLCLYIDEHDAQGALFADQLNHTINYAEAYDIASHEMQKPSALLEHVCTRIAQALIRKFSMLRKVDVSLTKCMPPINGYTGQGVTVRYSLKRELVAWDFDGTIADTSAGIVRTMTATFNEMGWTVPSTQAICRTIGLPLVQSIAQLAHIDAASEANLQAVNTYRRLFEKVGNKNVTLFPGIKEEMERQHRSGRFVAIATSRGHESVDALCRTLGIRHCIDYIVACEDVSTHKPHPAPIHLLCKQANVHPTDVTVIGDTTFDILMGRNAQAGHCIGVAWGNHSSQELLDAGADYVVDKF